jgi:hypothetical protein
LPQFIVEHVDRLILQGLPEATLSTIESGHRRFELDDRCSQIGVIMRLRLALP